MERWGPAEKPPTDLKYFNGPFNFQFQKVCATRHYEVHAFFIIPLPISAGFSFPSLIIKGYRHVNNISSGLLITYYNYGNGFPLASYKFIGDIGKGILKKALIS